MSSIVRVVIAEGDRGVAESLREVLSAAPDLTVVGEARSGREAIASAGRLEPDILLLDIDLSGSCGLDILPLITWWSPCVKVIIVSGHSDEATIVEALALGARGYIIKGDETSVVKAIRAVQCGEVWARRRVVARVLAQLVGLAIGTFQGVQGEPVTT
jgi:DNA-binding NarL/FixJ family response regulator